MKVVWKSKKWRVLGFSRSLSSAHSMAGRMMERIASKHGATVVCYDCHVYDSDGFIIMDRPKDGVSRMVIVFALEVKSVR